MGKIITKRGNILKGRDCHQHTLPVVQRPATFISWHDDSQHPSVGSCPPPPPSSFPRLKFSSSSSPSISVSCFSLCLYLSIYRSLPPLFLSPPPPPLKFPPPPHQSLQSLSLPSLPLLLSPFFPPPPFPFPPSFSSFKFLITETGVAIRDLCLPTS